MSGPGSVPTLHWKQTAFLQQTQNFDFFYLQQNVCTPYKGLKSEQCLYGSGLLWLHSLFHKERLSQQYYFWLYSGMGMDENKAPQRGLFDQAQVSTPYTPLFPDHTRTISDGIVPKSNPL